MNAVSERIKELRKARRMTQNEFAERINVTKSTVSAYENGSRLPSYDVLIRIARLFKVSTDHLLGYSEKTEIDVTGLTRKQINVIQDMIATYQRHNRFYQAIQEDNCIKDRLIAAGLLHEDDGEWMK
ncbi:helix-turn-helix domain-containing protein [Flavonifractor sp. An91]|uniref:helix-turn-helix domain-containing protein n=1 Tax=Flavonifractor sp. An91 TaxID=1965665 RepID=UPI000B5846DA|nr:helix-turn-helix transcriptional regulator [Flavonifractor sp. An91]OUN11494.1 hypothetical protein B5G42_08235 [Flavonifractor sp. An91]